jgi:succinate-semialdehyde dehydrogenase/glutarate-semialdehyde dehydrogenase
MAELSIRSWNFPAAMITRKAGAALGAGCTVVIKSPGETPFTVNALAELANRAGIPKGVINVVTALSNTVEVGHTLTSSLLVHKISFTGSTRVGKLLMRQCAETTVKKVSLELGGNAPFIVFPDADIDAAIDGLIISKFRGSGQTCVCANRIFVHQSVYDKFAAKLAAYVRNHFKVGDSLSTSGITHGPLIHQAAVQKVESHVKDAVSKGAIVLTGGSRLPALGPNFFAPTVLSNMHDSMQLASEETFGPVAGLFSFQTETEVIRRANQTEVGLAGYLFSRDVQRVWRVARALEIGMVGINTGVISDAAAP